jgi:hypothetical protein
MRFLLSCFAVSLLSSCSESAVNKAEPTAADETAPVASGTPASGKFRPMTFKNACWVNVRPEKDSVEKPTLQFHAIMRGKKASEEDSLVKVNGSCDYTEPGSPEIGTGGGLKPGWHCDSKIYQVDTGLRVKSHDDATKAPAYESVYLPGLIGIDMRGYTGAEGWYGERPEPRFEERDIVLDRFPVQGPGQLRFICPTAIPEIGFYDMKGCRISWRNEFQPEKTYFHGTCGEKVEVPGLYVAVDPNPK